ncbi:LPS export ABC transporter periplasmic protein LptC [Pelobium sp.]|nr:LPS export ABC transporter periplasmic protein LptC [Pelobium sp.]MDA9554693.1 LPS export ABC transporter periplasmic protein LptC [Pelobium sp.]
MFKSIAYIFSVILVVSIFTACENDLSKVKAIELKQKGEVEITKEAEIIYSDSAKVKAKLKTPILYNHKTTNPYYEMPKGIEVIFFDNNLKQTSKVTSDYAIRKENQKIVELHKNVVAVNAEGKTFKSDELIWDENLKRFYSNKVVTITTDKAVISGTSFWATEDFSYYEIKQGAGPIQFNEDLSQ